MEYRKKSLFAEVRKLFLEAAELRLMAIELRDEVFNRFPERRADAVQVANAAIDKAMGK